MKVSSRSRPLDKSGGGGGGAVIRIIGQKLRGGRAPPLDPPLKLLTLTERSHAVPISEVESQISDTGSHYIE